jgi:hypothetical protein
MANAFEQLLREQGGFRTKTVTKILPPRQQTSGPRTGARLSDAARSAGDRFYFAGSALASFVYSKIEERYAVLPDEAKYLKRKNTLMAEAKGILNEHRNQVVEAILPNYDVWFRGKGEELADEEPLPEVDAFVRDLMVKNVFVMLVRTFSAWLPEFVSKDQLESSEETLTRLSLVQREKLESELRNYRFGAKKIIAPPMRKG